MSARPKAEPVKTRRAACVALNHPVEWRIIAEGTSNQASAPKKACHPERRGQHGGVEGPLISAGSRAEPMCRAISRPTKANQLPFVRLDGVSPNDEPKSVAGISAPLKNPRILEVLRLRHVSLSAQDDSRFFGARATRENALPKRLPTASLGSNAAPQLIPGSAGLWPAGFDILSKRTLPSHRTCARVAQASRLSFLASRRKHPLAERAERRRRDGRVLSCCHPITTPVPSPR
jgi:hypothetical protein